MVVPTWDVTYKRINPYTGWQGPTTATVSAIDPADAAVVARETLGFGTFTPTGSEVCPYPEFYINSIVPHT